MTPEKQRIVIAKACGWLDIHRCTRAGKAAPGGVQICGTKDGPSINYPREYSFLPDYLNDLNAMHEAENSALWLTSQKSKYWNDLINVVTRSTPGAMCRCIPEMAISATAAQRAEAFLRTIGKWEGAP